MGKHILKQNLYHSSMGIMLLFLQFALFCMTECSEHEALVIIGGTYPDGSEMTEVEVWSPSPECGIKIKDTPIPFDNLDYSRSVAFSDGYLYVCGGQEFRPNNITINNRCYMYSMADNHWSEGPTLKFFLTPASSYSLQLWLTTVGDSVVAVFRQGDGRLLYMSTLIDNEWSEPLPLDGFLGDRIFSMVALDEKHFAMLLVTQADYNRGGFLEIINVETASRVTEVFDHGKYGLGAFLYNDKYSCLNMVYDFPYKSTVWSLTFQEDFTEPAWSVAYDLPDDIWTGPFDEKMAVVDGMLTGPWPSQGVVNYLDGNHWKTEALEIPREKSAVVVVPCD